MEIRDRLANLIICGLVFPAMILESFQVINPSPRDMIFMSILLVPAVCRLSSRARKYRFR